MASEKLWTRDFILGAGINFAIMTNYYCLMVVVADYAMKRYGSPASVAGLAASIFIIGALVSRVVSGSIMDRVGRKKLLLVVSTLEVVFSALYLARLELGILFILRFCHGFCYGAGSTTVGTIVTSVVPNSRKGEGIGYYMLSITVGAAIGPFLGMLLTQIASYEALFCAAIFIAVGNLIAVMLLKEPPSRRSNSHAVAIAKAAFVRKHKPSVKDFLEFSIMPLSAVCAVLYFCYSSLLTFLTPFSEESGLTSTSSFFFVVYAIATFVTRPFTGKIFDTKGDKYVMLPSFAAFIIGMALLSGVHHPLAMLIAAILLGFGVGTIQSSALTLCVRMAPDDRLALANSTFYMFLDSGVGIGPLVLGCIEPYLGYRGLFFCMSAVAACAMVAYMIVGRQNGRMRHLLAENTD